MKVHENPTQIRINKNTGTLILIAGVQGAGKSVFAKKHFDSSCIISFDDIFYQEFKNSGFKDVISEEKFYYIYELANDRVWGLTNEYSKSKPYTVFDSVGSDYRHWIEIIDQVKELYNQIILIIIHPPFKVTENQLSNREKNKIGKICIGMRAPNTNELFLLWQYLEMDIRSKKVGIKTDVTYIINNPENVNVILK